MSATPYKRDRRYKTRMNAGTDSERANLREKALNLARSGLNKRGGPVDQGSPDAQKAVAERLSREKRESRNERVKAGLGRPEVNTNKGSSRFGQRYRTILRKGGEVHDYGGTRVFVRKPESGGTGNHPPAKGVSRPSGGNGQSSIPGMISDPRRPSGSTYRPGRDTVLSRPVRTTDNVNQPTKPVGRPPASTYDRMARDLAKQRATQDRPRARRKLFASTAAYAPEGGGPPPRPGSSQELVGRRKRRRHLTGLGVGSSGKRQYV